MKTKILDINKIEKGSKELPVQFLEPIRYDLIQRAVLSIEASERQPYGSDPEAGQRHATYVSKRRRDYKTTYGHGISRVPRKIMSKNGTQMNWVAAKMPGVVGGRQAHPPKAGRNWEQKINEKENRKAIRSAIAASINPEIVKARGHKIPKEFPFIIDSKVESLKNTSDVYKMLEKLGFGEELERARQKKIRAGVGKNRGRRYKRKIGPLFVVSNECPLLKAAANIPGVQVVCVNNLNAKLLAPGTHPGRLSLWSEEAINRLAKENLFTKDYKGKSQKVEAKEVKKESRRIEKPKQEAKKTETKKSAKKAQ